jgi:phosphopantetheine adenylyltransferase
MLLYPVDFMYCTQNQNDEHTLYKQINTVYIITNTDPNYVPVDD